MEERRRESDQILRCVGVLEGKVDSLIEDQKQSHTDLSGLRSDVRELCDKLDTRISNHYADHEPRIRRLEVSMAKMAGIWSVIGASAGAVAALWGDKIVSAIHAWWKS